MPIRHASHGGIQLAAAVRELYRQGQSDYALEPLVRSDELGQPVGRVKDGDAVVFCCRRGEREVELTEAFTETDFPHFARPNLGKLNFIILTLYHEKFKDLPVAFAPAKIGGTLGEAVSGASLRQCRVAESEKFAHVTFFLNGGNNRPFPGEEDVRVPSPRGVAPDQAPQLSLPQVAENVVQALRQERYDLIVTNFANGDVIGHTANCEAKIQCAEVVDAHLHEVVETAIAGDYVVLVTADHGNLEEMLTPEGTAHVAHTTNLVPLILIDPRATAPLALDDGQLADIAPTVLSALAVEKPHEMTGVNLARRHDWGGRRRVLLVILDGWGFGRADESNPIHLARTPFWDALLKQYPPAHLLASGEAVGLQAEKAGNSEAGHMNIGAGRVVLQDDVRLDRSLKDGSFFSNEIFLHAMRDVRERGAGLHLIGLLSEKSSHGSIAYPLALLKMAAENGVKDVYLHLIFDGRSSAPGSAPALLEQLEGKMAEIGAGQIVTGVGRGIALDRDRNYARIQRVFDALVHGVGRAYTVQEEMISYEP